MSRIPHAAAVPPAPMRDPGQSLVAFQRQAFFDSVVWQQHDDFEMTLVLSGRGQRGVADSVESYEEGDLCLIGAGTPHGWEHPRHGPGVRARVVHFPVSVLQGCQSVPELRTIGGFLESARGGLAIGGRTRDAVVDEVMDLFEAPERSWKRPLHLLAALGVATTGGTTDVRRLASPGYTRPLWAFRDPRLQKVLDYIDRDIAADITHGRAADLAGLTGAAFSRFFRREVGRTFEDHVNGVRIGRACRELLQSDRSVTDIAFEAGFNSLAYFNRRFSRAKGMSPTAYRARAAPARIGRQ